jgi:hypothetical protein
MRHLTPILAILVLCSCAGRADWTKNGVFDPNQSPKDYRECDYEAQKATAMIMNGIERGYQRATLRGQCMEIRGYVWRQLDQP